VKKIVYLLSLLSLLSAGEITVAVAANVSYAIHTLKKAFEQQYPKTKVHIILGSSGKLTAQIRHGAPYDILLSADMKYPQVLYAEKIAITKPVVYAQGTLALLSTKQQHDTLTLSVLQHANIQKIAIANPKTAPYGIAAKEALENAQIYTKLKPKFIYGESISQTLLYTIHAADIGLVATSLLFSPKMAQYKRDIHWHEVDPIHYAPIAQGMVLLTHAKNNTEAKDFYHFMLSKEAKKILISYGYKVL